MLENAATDSENEWLQKEAGMFWPAAGKKEEKRFRFETGGMMRQVILHFIVFYQRYLRPCIPSVCRFTPSCSEYARQAVDKYGVTKGAFFAVMRLIRCHPWSRRAEYDPLV